MIRIPENSIAIIGLAGRFPEADSARALWDALCNGREAIHAINPEELEDSADEATRSAKNYVAARALLNDVDQFDAALFNFLPKDAELTDPQQRVLLETVWSALEDAGYAPRSCKQRVGLYAGCSINTYLLNQLASNPQFVREFTESYQVGSFSALIGNGQDFLATRISYKLNLNGPAMTVQSACSTSLLAVAQACGALRTGQTDIAVAGGVSISFPQKRGYLYQPGGMVSPDGHCRPFDANASGTVFGAGAGAVVLKRASEAVADGDYIYALICGVGVNNDGSNKVGYAAPSAEGQAAAIQMAHKDANIHADTIGFIECHGTGTPLGDPIELEALDKAFRAATDRKQFCTIGSLKGNIGHLDVAAGVTGLIKTALVLDQEAIPGTKHFRSPNPKLRLDSSAFRLSAETEPWLRSDLPRRAGVSAFGVGGTNVHAVLQEAPKLSSIPSPRESQLLVFSGLTPKAVQENIERVCAALQEQPTSSLADAAFTLSTGREAFPLRATIVTKNLKELTASKAKISAAPCVSNSANHKLAFLFPGQGSQYVGMGSGLYHSEPVYREAIDRCDEILFPRIGLHICELLLAERDNKIAEATLRATKMAQPALFTVSYAAARLWMSWGIKPSALLGHSLGELVAACIAGVISLEDGLTAAASRGALMDALAPGGMLAVNASMSQIAPYLEDNPRIDVAAENGPTSIVLSGSLEDITAIRARLTGDKLAVHDLRTSHAFHSSMVDSIVPQLEGLFASFKLNSPNMPIVSTVTGTWLTAEQATSPQYWAHHCRGKVMFAQGLACLISSEPTVLIECGAGNTLASLAKRQSSSNVLIQTTLPTSQESVTDSEVIQNTIGALWRTGISVNWPDYYANEKRRRTPLPSYSFQRQRYWIKKSENSHPQPALQATNNSEKTVDISMMNHSENISPETANTRLPELIQDVTTMLEASSGLQLDGTSSEDSFLELGLDSLFLTQLASELQKKYAVEISFRQLLNELSSPKNVAVYLDAKLPAKAPTVAVSVNPVSLNVVPSIPSFSSPAPISMGGQSDGVSQLLQQQISAMSELFRQQMQALGATVPATEAVAAPTQQSAPVPAPPVIKPSSTETIVELKTSPRVKQAGSTSSASPLTPEQSKFIDDLIRRYSERTNGSKSYTQKYRSVLADPRAVTGFRKDWKEMTYSLVVDRAQGSKLWDIDGNEYIDLVNGFGPTMFGHGPDFVINAVKEQIEKSFAIGPQSSLAGETATLIAEMTGSERVTFCNTGSEAVMAAMRLARTVTSRDKVVFFAGDYHGQFDEVLVRGIRRNGDPVSLPSAPGIPKENIGNIVVLEYGETAALDYLRQHAKELAAVIVEPVQSRHPDLQPREFLQEVRKITADSGTAFVFDEVVTGFRVHPGGAQAYFGIQADMATYGKVAGGGMPIGILAGKARFMDALDGGSWQFGDDSSPEVGMTFFAGTFVRHPLVLAATRATLLHIKSIGESAYQELNATADEFANSAKSLFAELGVPFTLENCGSVLYLAIPSEIRSSGLLFALLRERGVYAMEHFPLYITTSHSEQDLEKVLSVLRQSIIELQTVKIFPKNPSLAIADLDSAPLTAPQMEILLAAQMGDEQNCAFNESCTLHLEGQLDESSFAASWRELIQRHDALRLTLTEQAGVQKVHRSVNIPFADIDLSGLSKDDADAKVREYLYQDARAPFDLYRGPLLRAALIKTANEQHSFVMTAHHIICDGWSINLMMGELATLYSAAKERRSVQLTPARSFVEYARNVQAVSQEEQLNAESYWKNIFVELPLPLELPKDRLNEGERSFAGDTLIVEWPNETSVRLRKAGASLGCTLFVTLLGLWQMLLMRLASQNEAVVMIPSAAQSQLEENTLVGHCVHLLPIRARLEDKKTVAAFLNELKQLVLEAYEHQELTFGSLVQLLKVPREAGRLPLSEIQFNLEKMGANAEFSGLRSSLHANAKAHVNFDLFLNIVDTSNGLRLECDFNSDLYDRQTIEHWLGCYKELLEGFASDPRANADDLSLLSSEEQLHQLALNNPSEPRVAPSNTLIDRIQQHAASTPDAIAVEFYGQKMTYASLLQRSSRLAQKLAAQTIGKGDLVGIYLERSLDMVVAMVAISWSGAAYVPLDPLYPRERIAGICEETGMRMMLTGEEHISIIQGTVANFLLVDEDVRDHQVGIELTPPSTGDIAYVIFTSGSTGKPKGVQITHGNLINALDGIAQTVGFDKTGRLLAVTTLSFDIAELELLMPLVYGATVIIARRDDSSDGQRLLALLKASKATFMQATPITWRIMVAADMPPMPHLTMLCGGESWDRVLADNLLSKGGALWNMYGPTETTIWSAFQQVLSDGKPIGIQQSLPNQRIYILDSQQRLVPDGVSGELYIAGEGVGKGYYQREELTSSCFVDDIFSSLPGARMYKTGDRVRRRKDGSIEFCGRFDQQIKLRGFRIEPGEIEAALRGLSGIDQAFVGLRHDRSNTPRLVAYITSKPGFTPDTNALQEELGTKLPEYMIPAMIVALAELPLTGNGKVDRKRLPEPDFSVVSTASFVDPKTDEEKQLAAIWREVLLLDRVGTNQPLLSLGADSLHIFQIAARAQRVGLSVTARHLMKHKTIEAICNTLSSENSASIAKNTSLPLEIGLKRAARDHYRVANNTSQAVHVEQA